MRTNVPEHQIRWLINSLTVRELDEYIIQFIDTKTTNWPPSAREQARKIALNQHHRNQKLVRDFRL